MVKVKKVELKKIKCSQCKYAVIIKDAVLCLNRKHSYSLNVPYITNTNNECLVGVHGKPITDNMAISKLLEIYVEVDRLCKEIEEIKRRLANMVKENVPIGKYSIHDNIVVVDKYSKKILDTKKVKDLLKKQGILDKFLIDKEIKYVKIIDSKRKR